MRKNSRLIVVIIFLICLLSLLFISTYLYINDSNNKKRTTKISVIVYGGNSDRWDTLKQGLDQAAADFGADMNFVTMTSENDALEQKMLLNREIANGAKGIILAVTDSKAMSDAVNEASSAVPVVMVETTADNTDGLIFISADNYSMGLDIGRSVVLNSNDKKITIFMDNQNRSSVGERYHGLMDYFSNTDYIINQWKMDGNDADPTLFLQRKMKEDPTDIIVAMDDISLEEVVDAFSGLGSGIKVYGIGSTNKIVHYLDNGVINSIVFQNEFNMGYLSIQEMMNKIKKDNKALNIDIEYRTLNKETMYLPQNQRMVFPIVQ